MAKQVIVFWKICSKTTGLRGSTLSGPRMTTGSALVPLNSILVYKQTSLCYKDIRNGWHSWFHTVLFISSSLFLFTTTTACRNIPHSSLPLPLPSLLSAFILHRRNSLPFWTFYLSWKRGWKLLIPGNQMYSFWFGWWLKLGPLGLIPGDVSLSLPSLLASKYLGLTPPTLIHLVMN